MGAARVLSVAALAAGAAAVAAIALGSQGPVDRRPAIRSVPLRPLLPPGSRVLGDRTHALRVAVPPGWTRGRESLLPGQALPSGSILTVATFRARAEPRRACGNWPDMPQAEIGPRDALLHVEEELDAQPGSRPRRPKRLRLQEQLRVPRVNEPVASVFPWRCLNRVGIAGLRTSFRTHGRWLHVTAVAGEHTSRRRRRELLGILESLRFGPVPPVAVRVEPALGGPRTRFRLELVSTHRTGRRGRRVREYWAAVRGPLRTACVIQNEAWFSYGPPGATLHAELDPRRTKGNRWCRGRFRGVVRYRDAICGGINACERVNIRRAGSFGFSVR